MSMSENEVKCNSFVFLDIESTGIPFREADGGKTQITEISFICISRESLEKVHHELPRKLPKLTINFNPHKTIPDEVTRITGLDNSMLENENPFDWRKAALIKGFLEDCKPPICLVAHNGDRFDFPLLKEELMRFPNMIPENARCGDTILAFRDLYNRPDINQETLTFNPFISGTDMMLVDAAKDIENRNTKKVEVASGIDDTNMTLRQMLNETTPPSKRISPNPNPLSLEVNYRKRKLFDGDSYGNISSSNPVINRSFALTNVYQRIFGREPECSHRAEDDTQTLIKCALKFGKPLLDWFDKNSKAYRVIRSVYHRH